MACVIRGIYDTEKKEGDFLPYVPVPKDLTKVKTKVAFNLTKRQLIFFSIAGAVGLPVYFLTRTAIGLKNMIRHRLWPETRPYKTRNFYKIMSKKEEISIAKNQTAGSTGKAPAGKHPAGAKKPVRSKKGR